MKSLVTTVLLAGLCVGALFGLAPTAKADFGGDETVSIHNATRATIQFQVKWGGGSWRSIALKPGQRQSFDASSGAPMIRFDHVLGDSRIDYKGFALEPNSGYSFHLAQRGAVTYLVLRLEEVSN